MWTIFVLSFNKCCAYSKSPCLQYLVDFLAICRITAMPSSGNFTADMLAERTTFKQLGYNFQAIVTDQNLLFIRPVSGLL